MIYLALETSTDRASVALGRSDAVLTEESLPGARQHASGLLPMIREVMASCGVELDELEGVLLTDGPGSFTGLRIGAAMAKALVYTRGLELWVCPSLLVRAGTCLTQCSGSVLAVADALRGDVFAAGYTFPGDRVEMDLPPGVYRPEELVKQVPRPEVLAGTLSEQLLVSFDEWLTGGTRLMESARPSAGMLLRLMGRAGAVTLIDPNRVAGWEPAYGRPAEAQARWEADHGRPIDHPGSPA